MKWAMYMCLATETREKEAGVRNETINKPAQDSPLLSAFLLWHMLVFFRVQHIEFDCFGCSCSWFLAPVLASGVPGRVHPLPRSQAQPRGAHQHRLPSEKLVFCQGHGGNRVYRWGGRAADSHWECQGSWWHKRDMESQGWCSIPCLKKNELLKNFIRWGGGAQNNTFFPKQV